MNTNDKIAKAMACVFAKDLVVKNLMTRSVPSITSEQSLMDLKAVMDAVHARHIPVMNNAGKFVGLVSHRDLLRHSLSLWPTIRKKKREAWLKDHTVAAVMKEDHCGAVAMTQPEVSLRTAAIEMKERKIGCLPVFNQQGKLEGILSERDFMKYFLDSKATTTLDVQDLMTENCVAVDIATNMKDASELMAHHGIRHLPVVDDKKRLVGLVSHRDVLSYEIAEESQDHISADTRKLVDSVILVREIMREKVISVEASCPLKDATKLMLTNEIGCLPVVTPQRQVVGILTEGDFLRFFSDAL